MQLEKWILSLHHKIAIIHKRKRFHNVCWELKVWTDRVVFICRQRIESRVGAHYDDSVVTKGFVLQDSPTLERQWCWGSIDNPQWSIEKSSLITQGHWSAIALGQPHTGYGHNKRALCCQSFWLAISVNKLCLISEAHTVISAAPRGGQRDRLPFLSLLKLA